MTAIRLGQAGVSTVVLESHDKLLDLSRAVGYIPVVFPVLASLGILEEIEKLGYKNTSGAVWRDLEHNVLGSLPVTGDDIGDYGGILHLGQRDLSGIALNALKAYPCVEVKFGHRCVGIEEISDGVKVMVNHKYDDQLLLADYVLGADGSNSFVRRASCIPFEGYSWKDAPIVAIDMLYDFEKECGLSALNFYVDPVDWMVIVNTGRGGVWRVAYLAPGLSTSDGAAEDGVVKRIEKYIKLSKEYQILRAAPFTVHQRCASTFRKGRVLLIGDAAHVSRVYALKYCIHPL